MKKIILFLILLSNLSYGWDEEAAKFYPLAIGNVWSYHHTPYGNTFCYPLPNTSDYIVSIIGDTVLPNNKKYFKFSNGYLERIDSNTMNVYRFSQPHELMLDTLLARLSDHFNGFRLDFFNYNCSVSDTAPYYFANTSWRAKKISLSANGTNEYDLANGLGLVGIYRCFQTGYRDILNGCIINGIQYGTIVGFTVHSSELPMKYSLIQNYPNPFNPVTKIKFDIPLSRGVDATGGRGVFVKLVIYDILGSEVATLVNEQLKPGTYEYEWPAPSGDGSNFASGIYFYKLKTSDFVQTKKMVLLR